MSAFVVDPQLIDWILILVALEAIGVLSLRSLTRRGPPPVGFLCNLLAGAALLLALRGALAGASALIIAASLAAAFVAHLADLALRWEKAPRVSQSTIGKVTASAQARPKAAPSAPTRGSRVRA
ncbi:hypothetical protein [Methylocystis rosea]|uniref:hypothetical protein n=1 Tax=Methylocystis rosea TaxID=173366 RepID=UPI0018A6B3FA|nr:hypothetical protein [Methylocystis rosea]